MKPFGINSYIITYKFPIVFLKTIALTFYP